MRLHQNEELFRQAIISTSQKIGIAEIYIEKDYWVCYALHLIYNSAIKDAVIFKGGTALSKCNQLIERFSEDIDLVVLRKDGESGNQLKNKLKKITNAVGKPFKEEYVEGVTNKMGMIRKVAYNYPKAFKGDFGQVRDQIIIEATWLGNFEPYTTKKTATYIHDMMLASNQEILVQKYNLMPFELLVLDARRTLCEKIMSLVRFSHTETAIVDLNNKIRHLYDIHQLLKNDEIKTFFESEKFYEMLLKVAQDDVQSFRNNNTWLNHHPKEAILFKAPKDTWSKLENTYVNSFSNLVYGELPNENEVLKTIQTVSARLEGVTWSIKV
ncbi:nucleotidyl transferase AbiEii/AbiGii toxin family protein [Algibacter pacificus]|uniref:nucleotidyl transferase AbiEii/AbiGii toxin family protein n=1 Tax=Algibacter pacificus TaxID=2599389 RepID=UPI0011CAC217|nr:nucleotidyl transferase AbiEii/AbiGii toxin family protein [Algibacter pacificus]